MSRVVVKDLCIALSNEVNKCAAPSCGSHTILNLSMKQSMYITVDNVIILRSIRLTSLYSDYSKVITNLQLKGVVTDLRSTSWSTAQDKLGPSEMFSQ